MFLFRLQVYVLLQGLCRLKRLSLIFRCIILILLPFFQCLAWNLVCVLTMVAMTMVCVGVVILLPTMLEVVPLSPIQQLQG